VRAATQRRQVLAEFAAGVIHTSFDGTDRRIGTGHARYVPGGKELVAGRRV
jgi:hypothetical protein